MLYHMLPLTKRNTGGMINLTCFSFFATSFLRELSLPVRKTSMFGETCHSLAKFLGEVKFPAIFSFEEKNLPLGEMSPPFGNIGLRG